MRKIVVAPDSFKGSLTAREVAECCRDAIAEVLPDVEVVVVPLADGGEGTVDVLADSFGGKWRECRACDPLRRSLATRYLVSDDGRTALMEAAQTAGLTLLADSERDPMLTTTFGLGQMIADAIGNGCRKISVGLGGSSTNDCGTGMLSELGYRFLDAGGNEVSGCGGNLIRIASIEPGEMCRGLSDVEFTVACDVSNPLTGPRGATAVFSRQKGADEKMMEELEKGMVSFAKVVEDYTGVDVSSLPGAGAAGGLGAAFASFLGARMTPGIEMVLDLLDFDRVIDGAALIITGEGKIDSQSLMGKVVSGVQGRARLKNVPVLAIGGMVDCSESLKRAGFKDMIAVKPEGMPLTVAMRRDVAAENIRRSIRNYFTAAVADGVAGS